MELKLGKYEHYKGKQKEVIGLARHSETLEELVIYKSLYDSEEFGKNALWARPKSMFLETVNIEGKEIPRFGENQRIMFTIGVFGIITDNKGRVLLCHRRDYDLWNLPGGGVEAGESPWDALVREIKEETGLEARPVQLTGVYSKPDKNEIVLSFACQITGGKITPTDEADKIEYFEVGQIPKNTAPKQVERIQDFFSDQSKTHYRVQTGPSSIDLIKQGKI